MVDINSKDILTEKSGASGIYYDKNEMEAIRELYEEIVGASMVDTRYNEPWPTANSIHKPLSNLMKLGEVGYVTLTQVAPESSHDFMKLNSQPLDETKTIWSNKYEESLSSVKLLEDLLKYDDEQL